MLTRILLVFILSISVFSSCKDELRREVYEPTNNRTFLLYIVGDNNLSSYSISNIRAIKEALSDSKGYANILVYEDSNREEDEVMSSPTLWKFYLLEGKVYQEVVKMYPEQNSVDPDIMTGVIGDAFSLYPSEEKIIAFWGHGSGWLPNPTYSPTSADPSIQYAYGPDNSDWLDIPELGDILDMTGLHFDAIIFDACNMACIEVAYELKDNADYMILSPAEIMGSGIPYSDIIPVICDKQLDLTRICQRYMDFYNGKSYGYYGTISLIRTSEIENLSELYRDFLRKYLNQVQVMDGSGIQQLGRSSLGFGKIFFDLEAVVTRLMTPEELAAFKAQLDKTVVYHDYTDVFFELPLANLCGLTVYLPSADSNYRNLGFYYTLSFTKSMPYQ